MKIAVVGATGMVGEVMLEGFGGARTSQFLNLICGGFKRSPLANW